MFPPLAWVIVAYLLGSVPFGLLLSKLKGRDPRAVGSGNIGATNVMRTAGTALAVTTLACDIAKGFFPAWLAWRCGQPDGVVAAAGFAAFVGHIFPIYLRFRGGKGVATAVGAFLAMSYLAVLIVFLVFAAVVLVSRYVSLGSLIGAAAMPLILFLLHAPLSFTIICAIMAVLIFIKHKDNIRRLREGREHRIVAKSA